MQDLKDFLDTFASFKKERMQERKRLGKNDYNPLLKVLPAHDEVNLHSGILESLLDPSENHNQKKLFLKLFLKEIGLYEWFGKFDNVKVSKEYKYIDIYIRNDTKHIILENKIRAGDQDEQIAKYIKTLNEKEKVDYENIVVIYLTPYGDREPNKESLGCWEIMSEDRLFLQNNDKKKIEYKQISYELEILSWLEKCREKIKNLCNLNQAIEFYKDVVKIITNQKESSMCIIEFLKEKAKSEKNYLNLALEISKQHNEIFKLLLEDICNSLELKNWEIDTTKALGKNIPFIFRPKEHGERYFAFAWHDFTANYESFSVRLLGGEDNIDERKSIFEEIIGSNNISEFSGDNFWNYESLRLKTLDTESITKSIKDFIKNNIEIIEKANKKILMSLKKQ